MYYTLLIYILQKSDNETDKESDNPNSIYSRPSHLIDVDDLYVNISGTIEMVNSYGYLNAEQYRLIQYYLWVGLIYCVVALGWTQFMIKYQN